jgi:limonene-1,2-epoxide hydrolase
MPHIPDHQSHRGWARNLPKERRGAALVGGTCRDEKGKTMSETAMNAEQIVRDFLALFHTAALDTVALRAMLADDAQYQPVVPIAPVRQGADAIVGEMERQYQLYDECACEILNLAISGRTDTVRQIANGQATTTCVVGVFDLDENGKIAWWREYWDALDCAGQLGIDDKAMRGIMCA